MNVTSKKNVTWHIYQAVDQSDVAIVLIKAVPFIAGTPYGRGNSLSACLHFAKFWFRLIMESSLLLYGLIKLCDGKWLHIPNKINLTLLNVPLSLTIFNCHEKRKYAPNKKCNLFFIIIIIIFFFSFHQIIGMEFWPQHCWRQSDIVLSTRPPKATNMISHQYFLPSTSTCLPVPT